jgi:magnesium transporter
MPIVASMGGNAGTQALAVAVRAIAARDLTESSAPRYILREAMTAISNGLIFAVLLAGVVMLWFHNVLLAVSIACAVLITFACAGLAGILVPLTLRRAGADPAVSSSVFVTFVTDIVGFLAFLGLATLILLR